MDCLHARLLLMFARPGASEVAPPELDLLHGHLDRCGDCRALAQRESHSDAGLALAMRAVPLPDGLQGRILQNLSRQPHPWPWTWIASAAGLLLAVGLLVVCWNLESSPQLSSDDFCFGADNQAVIDWFHHNKLNVRLPSEFLDTRYLESAAIVSIQGRLVPKLMYVNVNAFKQQAVAHVYVISKRDFGNVKDFSFNGSSHACQVHECPGAPGYFFLIIYTSGSREDFLVGDGTVTS